MKIFNSLWNVPIIKKTVVSLFSKKLKTKLYNLLTNKAKKVDINPELEKQLKKEFKIEVEKTSKLIGIDLVKKWNY